MSETRESKIIYETPDGRFWVDSANKRYTVYRAGVTHSISDSAYPLTPDGLSLAKYRAEYLSKHVKINPLFRRPTRKEVSLDHVRELQEEESESLCRHQDFAGARRTLKQRPASYARARGLRIEKKDAAAKGRNLLEVLEKAGRKAMAKASGKTKTNPASVKELVRKYGSLENAYNLGNGIVTDNTGTYTPEQKARAEEQRIEIRAEMDDLMRQIENVETAKSAKRNPGHFIQGAIKRPGALHRKLGIPQSQIIPVSKIREAIAHPGRFVKGAAEQKLLQQEARFALTLEGRKINPRSATRQSYRSGVRVCVDTPLAKGEGTVASLRDVGSDHRGVPNIPGAYAPLKSNDVIVRLDSGQYAIVSKSRLRMANPDSDPDAREARDLYQSFHGKASTRTSTAHGTSDIPPVVAALGELTEITLASGSILSFDGKGFRLTSNPAGSQLYIIGRADFTSTDLGNFDTTKDLIDLGPVKYIVYRTKKGFDNFKEYEYKHKLGEESGDRPSLIYDCRNHRLLIAGGNYEVRPEGIVD